MIADRTVRLLSTAAMLALLLSASAACAQSDADNEGEYLYQVRTMRAAPGEWTALVEDLGAFFDLHEASGEERPLLMRHSQGDQWDFMVVVPMGDRAAWHAPEREGRRQEAWQTAEGQALAARIGERTAWREDWFARSIPVDALRAKWEGAGLYHVELFAGLPGQRDELLEQRRMENRYYRALDRSENAIFVRDVAAGANWDAMTIGFHPSLAAFAAGGDATTAAEQDVAAREAGFTGVDAIGPYLRSLLSYHNDTLGVPVR